MRPVGDQRHLREIKGRPLRRSKRGAAPVFGLWLFLLFSCLLAAYFFIHSTFFMVNRLEVKGANTLQPEQIIEQSGLVLGVNLFQARTTEAKERIEQLPYVKTVQLKRKLPQAIQIQLVERIPMALVVAPNGFLVVDEESVCLHVLTMSDPLALPIISGIPLENSLHPGMTIVSEGLDSALLLCDMLDQAILSNVAEIVAPSPHSLTLKTIQGIEVRFGEPVDLERKVRLIQELLLKDGSYIDHQTVEYIDLRYDTAPVIKRRS